MKQFGDDTATKGHSRAVRGHRDVLQLLSHGQVPVPFLTPLCELQTQMLCSGCQQHEGFQNSSVRQEESGDEAWHKAGDRAAFPVVRLEGVNAQISPLCFSIAEVSFLQHRGSDAMDSSVDLTFLW